jgi:hypothetical protein
MITTTTFLHMGADDSTKVDVSTSGNPLLEFGESRVGSSVTVFLASVARAQELAQAILARFPLPEPSEDHGDTVLIDSRLKAAWDQTYPW